MAPESAFQDLIRRVRNGNQQAAFELVNRYGPQILRVARFELGRSRLRRVLDSMDIWDSVLATFFLRAATGQFEIETPKQLLALLSTMVRNKMRNYVEYEQAAKRDRRRVVGVDLAAMDVASPQRTPSRIVADRELLDEFFRRLPEDLQEIARRRGQGVPWQQLSTEFNTPVDTLRKRLTRASERIVEELTGPTPDRK